MSLQDEVMTIISLSPDGNHADLTDEYIHGYIESQAEDAMNKVLDAAVEAMLEYNGSDSKMNYLKIVNKLRPEK